jgi:hypothetical protein
LHGHCDRLGAVVEDRKGLLYKVTLIDPDDARLVTLQPVASGEPVLEVASFR